MLVARLQRENTVRQSHTRAIALSTTRTASSMDGCASHPARPNRKATTASAPRKIATSTASTGIGHWRDRSAAGISGTRVISLCRKLRGT